MIKSINVHIFVDNIQETYQQNQTLFFNFRNPGAPKQPRLETEPSMHTDRG